MPLVGSRLFLSRAIVEIGIFSAFINIFLLVMPMYMLQVYDRIIPSSSLDTLYYISIIAVVVVLVLTALDAVRAYYGNRLAARLDVTFGPRLFEESLEGQRAVLGDVQPLRDLATIRNFIGSRAIFFLFDLPFGPFFIALLYFVHPVVFGVTIAGAIVMIGLALATQALTRKNNARAADALNAATISAQTFARNAETVRTLGMKSGVSAKWGEHFSQSLHASDKLMAVNATFGSLSRGVRIMLQIAIYGIGAYLTLNGQMTAGMIFAAAMISARALQPLDQIVGSWKQISDASAAWKRISTPMKTAETSDSDQVELPTPKGAISIEKLIYHLPNAKDRSVPLIKRISFAVGAGQTLAMIGPSQAGKSTVARLIVGAIDPSAGTVRYDGADIKYWDREKLGASIGYLSQEVELFPGSIGQNVARFEENATSEEIIAAARRAQVHDMILAQPQGYETIVGPMGVRLSGGERQRIGLARAFYGDPRLIVLDEPNANLDAEGEAALEKTVRDASQRGATVVVITHRPSIAGKCDMVLLLRDGQIADIGPAHEVLKRLAGTPAPQ